MEERVSELMVEAEKAEAEVVRMRGIVHGRDNAITAEEYAAARSSLSAITCASAPAGAAADGPDRGCRDLWRVIFRPGPDLSRTYGLRSDVGGLWMGRGSEIVKLGRSRCRYGARRRDPASHAAAGTHFRPFANWGCGRAVLPE
jgi:hypothetical protein